MGIIVATSCVIMKSKHNTECFEECSPSQACVITGGDAVFRAGVCLCLMQFKGFIVNSVLV